LLAGQATQRGFQLLGFKSERPWPALVSNASICVDQVNAVWPACVGSFRGVLESVDYSGKFDSQLAHTSSSHQGTLLEIFRTGEDNFVADVAFHLPNVTGMRFKNVHGKEGNTIAVLFVKFVERRNLPPEWRSSVAAEYQHDRLLRVQCRKLHGARLVQLR